MTINKPESPHDDKHWLRHLHGGTVESHTEFLLHGYKRVFNQHPSKRSLQNHIVRLSRLIDELRTEREALQAECYALKSELAESRANDKQAMAYLEAVREIVGGDSFPEMIGRVKELQIERNGYKLALKWVQETASVKELGKHRADVMRERIQELQEERDQLLAAIRRLCNIYVVDGYYEGEMREKLLDEAVNRAIERGKENRE